MDYLSIILIFSAVTLSFYLVVTMFFKVSLESLEKRKNKRPRLTDLQKVGIPEDGADQIIFLYRDRYYDYEGEDGAEWIVAKSPQGKTGTVYLNWDYETGNFYEAKLK